MVAASGGFNGWAHPPRGEFIVASKTGARADVAYGLLLLANVSVVPTEKAQKLLLQRAEAHPSLTVV